MAVTLDNGLRPLPDSLTMPVVSLADLRDSEKQLLAAVATASAAVCDAMVPAPGREPSHADLDTAYTRSCVLTLQILALLFAGARDLLSDSQTEGLRNLLASDEDCSTAWRALTHPWSDGLFEPSLVDHAAASVGNAAALLSGPKWEELFRALPVTTLGKAYEAMLGLRPVWDADSVSYQPTRHNRKSTGRFYTPPVLVDYIVRQAVGPLVDELATDCPMGMLPERLLTLKILDPACGCGDFLLRATRFIGEAIAVQTDSPPQSWTRLAAERCVYGVDTDPIAVAVTRTALWLDTASPGDDFRATDNVRCGNSLIGASLESLAWAPDISKRQPAARHGQPDLFQGLMLAKLKRLWDDADARASLAPLRRVADLWISAYLGNNFDGNAYEDALFSAKSGWFANTKRSRKAASLAEDKHPVHWEMEFPEVFFENGEYRRDPGFNAVLGNPPYVAGKNENMIDYQRIHGLYGQSDYYLLFLSNIIRKGLVRRGGYLSMVLPDPFLARRNAASVRRSLLKQWTMISMLHIGGMFPGAMVANAVPVCRNLPGGDYSLTVRRVDSTRSVSRFARGHAEMDEYHSMPASLGLAQPGSELLYLTARPSPFNVFPIVHGERGVAGHCRLPFVRLGDLDVEIFRGEEIGKSSITSESGELPVLLGGQSVAPYSISWEGRRMDSHQVRKPLERYLSDKIVLQKSAAKLIAAGDILGEGHAGYVVPQSVYCIRTGEEGPDLFYLLALLNSTVLNDYTYRAFTGYKLVQPQIEIEDLRRLPIRHVEFVTPADEREEMIGPFVEAHTCDPAEVLAAADRWLADGLADAVHDLIAAYSRRLVECLPGDPSYVSTREILDRLVSLLYGSREAAWQGLG